MVAPYRGKIYYYTLPLVIEALDTIGAPHRIRKLEDEEQRGPLLATLASQLASTLTALIRDALKKGIGHEKIDDI